MIKVFNETDTTFETNGEVVLNPTYAVVHKEDNGDYYLDLETQLTDETKTIPYEEGSIATINSTGQITADSTKESHLLSLEGETQQDSTIGQNLFNIFDPLTMGDIVNIDNDGWITVTYDNSSGTRTKWFDCKTKTSNLVNTGQSYRLIAEIKSVSGTGTFNLCVDQAIGQVATTQSISLGNATIGTKIYNITMKNSFSGCTSFLNSYGKFEAGQSGSITLRISVVANTSITPETFKYEPYTNGPAPNPTYPFDIHNVSGDNTIEICGKNLCDIENLTFKNGYYSASGVWASANNNGYIEYINVLPNTSYTFSINTTAVNIAIYEFNKDKTFIKRNVAQNTTSNTIITDSNTKYLAISVNLNNSTTITKTIFGNWQPQLEKGNQATTFEAYTGNSQLISLGVENLFDKDNANVLNAYINASKVLKTSSGDRTIYIPCKPNTTYSVKKMLSTPTSDNKFRVCTYSSIPVAEATGIDYVGYNTGTEVTEITITTSSTANYLAVYMYTTSSTSTFDEMLASLEITKGNKPQYISASPIELCKIENQDHTIKYQDSIFFNDPSSPYYNNELQDYKWFLHKEIGKYTFTGNETPNSITNGYFYYTSSLSNISYIIGGYNTKFKFINDDRITDNGTANTYLSDNQMAFRLGKGKDRLYIKTQLSSSNLKSTLANEPLYYVLETSTDTEITNEELLGQLNSIKVINGLNNISVNSPNLIPSIQIQYNHVTGGEVSTNDYIQPNKILVANTPTGSQPFRITNIEKNRRRIRLQAKHLSYDSENYVIEDSYVVDKTCNQALDHLNNATDNTSPFTTTSDITTINSYRCVRKSLWEAINVVLERWGGHLTRNNWQIGIMNSIGQDNGVVVRYAKNLKNIDVQYDWSQVVTKILPVGEDGLLLDEVFLYADIQYDIPYTKVVKFDQNIDDESYRDEDGVLDEDAYKEALKADLRSQATAYLQEHYIPQVNYELNANLEKITDIGDTIQVKDERLGIDLLTNLISYDYDCILEKYKTLEFGNFRKTISDLTTYINTQTTSIVDDSVTTTRITLQNELETATSQIWGVLGNSYVINEGDKILIVDSLPKETATNVWMFNNGGLAFSNTGINGTFKQAWTIDGTFNTQNINVINFTADLIKGGALKLGSNVNQNGILEVYDEANNLIALLNKDGLRMNAVNGDYVLINQNVGFAGYDRNNVKIYWADGDEFHMKKSVVEEEITLVDKMRIIPITITDEYDQIINDGIGFVSTL